MIAFSLDVQPACTHGIKLDTDTQAKSLISTPVEMARRRIKLDTQEGNPSIENTAKENKLETEGRIRQHPRNDNSYN